MTLYGLEDVCCMCACMRVCVCVCVCAVHLYIYYMFGVEDMLAYACSVECAVVMIVQEHFDVWDCSTA